MNRHNARGFFWSRAATLLVCGCTLAAGSGLRAGEPAPAADAQESAASDKTRSVRAGDLELKIPQSWKRREPKSESRVAEYEIPAVEEDPEPGEFVVFYFQGQGGSVEDNVKRWLSQFDAKGRKAARFTGKCAAGNYTLLDISGTYNKPVGPPIAGKSKKLARWRVINVYLETEQGPYFVKLDAPARTAAKAQAALRAALGADPKAEEEVAAEE